VHFFLVYYFCIFNFFSLYSVYDSIIIIILIIIKKIIIIIIVLKLSLQALDLITGPGTPI